jgi:hypothetical protein
MTAPEHLGEPGNPVGWHPETTGRRTSNDRIGLQLPVSNHSVQTRVRETRKERTLWSAKKPGADVLGRCCTAGEIKQTSTGTTDTFEWFIRTTVGADDA